jgi:3-oxoacyl-[acyl-carrier-protein] synthase-3
VDQNFGPFASRRQIGRASRLTLFFIEEGWRKTMLYIHGVGHFHPENIIDNRFFESLDIGVTDKWITDRTGIRSRNTVLPHSYITETRNRDPRAANEASQYTNAETGRRAALMALERAGLEASSIGMVVAGGSAPRMSVPGESCVIANELNLMVPAVDVNSACSTFAVQLRLLSLMDAEALPDFILVVNPENVTRTVNYDDRSTAILVGDCTSAAVVSKKVPSRVVVRNSMHESDPAGWNKVVIPIGGNFWQDGGAVQLFAIRKTVAIIERLREYASRAGIPDERHLFNVDRHGNCGAAGGPSVLSERWEQFGPGDEVIMAVVGSGLTWAGLRLTFEAQ